uniref:Uncharacterized protein n=1 Tax=Sus scrofa TaxID=9823 RepID=A0A4X1TFZ0_PIG
GRPKPYSVLCISTLVTAQATQVSPSPSPSNPSHNKKRTFSPTIAGELPFQYNNRSQEVKIIRRPEALQTVAIKGGKRHLGCIIFAQAQSLVECTHDAWSGGRHLGTMREASDESVAMAERQGHQGVGKSEMWENGDDMKEFVAWVAAVGSHFQGRRWRQSQTCEEGSGSCESCTAL